MQAMCLYTPRLATLSACRGSPLSYIPVFNCERKDRCIVETRRLYQSPHILYMSEPHTHSITVSEPAVVTQV